MRLAVNALLPTLLLCMGARADEATRNAKAEELLQLTNASQMINQVFEQIKSMEIAQIEKMDVPPAARPRLQEAQTRTIELLEKAMNWDRMKPLYIKLYTDTFTEDELDGIVAFYRSPAGQSMLQKMPTLMQKSMQLGQQAVANIMPELQKTIDDAVKSTPK